MNRLRLPLAALLLVLLGLVALAPAFAQESEASVTIREAVLDDDGATTVTVSVAGSAIDGEVPAEAFSVTEDGEPVEGLDITPLRESVEAEPVVVMITFDTSGSTEGEPLANAQAAASDFVDAVVPAGVQVGLVAFSDTAQLEVAPTADAGQLRSAIAGLEASGETSLHDAVIVSARTLQNFDGQRSIVVFSDGADTASEATVDGAVVAAHTVEAAVTAVALQTGELDVAALQELADATGGRLLTVDDAASLQSAFESVAQDLTSQYVLTYEGFATGAEEIDLTVSLTVDGVEASDQARVLSPRTQATAGEPRVVSGSPSLFTNDAVLFGALGVAFVGLLLFLFVLIVPRGDRRVSRTLQRGMRMYDRAGERAMPTDAATRLASASVTQGAVRLVSRVPRPAGYDEQLQLKLDRAGWQLRSTEFTAARVGLGLIGFVVGWGLLASVLMGLVVAVVLVFLPSLLLDGRVAARQARFLEQLPDTLQLIAGALKAGYGIMQAIDTVVKEAPEPTASEFSRVLTESRLGLPLEDSLEAMAQRTGSEDFGWVVVAINIQRRVGGNLAELLDTVADTLRERQMVRRQIKTLSAEGRLSAIILVAMPFVIALYLFTVNRAYLSILFERTVGQIMMAGAVVLMILGVAWMRKLIDIDV